MLASIGITLLTNVKKYGYLAVFLGVMLENAGIPVPGETILLTASGFARSGRLSIFIVVATAAIAAIIGDNVGFFVGRYGGRPLVEKYGRYFFIRKKQLDRVDSFFTKYGPVAVFLARFIAGARVVTALVAGTSDMLWHEFLLFNALGALVWASAVSAAGYYGVALGRELLPVLRSLHISIYAVIVIVVIAWLVGHLILRRRQNQSL